MSSVRKGWVLGLLAGALALVVTAPGTTLAQTSTGTIRGHVLDENGQPLTAAGVQATSTATNYRRGMLTEEGGFYNLGGLPVGEYNVEFSHPSYGAQTQNVRVQIGQTLNIDVVLFTDAIEVAGIEAVIARERIIEPETPEVATNITRAQIENLPLLNRDFLDFAALAPGVTQTRNGNSVQAGGLPSENINLFIDGASFKNDVLREGIVGQDASPGNPFPQNAVQEFRVITQNYKAEYQKAAGAVITATTKSGTNQWQATGFYLGQNEGFIAKDAFQACEAPGQGAECVEQDVRDVGRQQFGGSLSGPLAQDVAFVFGAYEGNYRNIPQTVQAVSAENLAMLPADVRSEIESIQGTTSNQELRSNLFFGKFTAQPAEKHSFEASLNVRDEFEVRGFGGFDARSRAEDFNNDVYTAIGKWQYSSGQILNEAHVDWQRFHWNPIPLEADQVGRVYEGILAIGGRPTEQDFKQTRFEIRDDLSYTLPNHALKTGVYASFLNYDVTKFQAGNPEFRFRQAEGFEFPFQATLGAGDPNIEDDNVQYGVFVQDDYSPTDRLILNFGLRWDVETNMLNNDWVTPDSVREEIAQFLTPEQQEDYFTDGNQRDPFYGAVQPRIGFTYDLTGNKATTLFGGFGIFYDRTFFNAGLDERFRLGFPVYLVRFSEDGSPDPNGNPTVAWDDRFFDREALLDLVEGGTPAGKPEIFLLENDTKPPRAQQWTFGVRQAIGDLMLSANYTGVRGDNVFTWVFGNRREDGSCCLSTDRFGNLLLSTDDGETWYDALLFQIGKPFSVEDNWGAQVAYTLAEAEVNTADLFTLDVLSPEDFSRFPSNNDIRHNLTLNWIFGIPWDIRFSGIASFRSAFPISARVGNDPNNNGIGGDDFVNNETRNSRRIDDARFSEVDIRFEKGFEFATGQRIAVLAEIFNLFDTENYDGFNESFGNFNRETGLVEPNLDFGRPNSLADQSPSRRLQLGVRYGL
jgi:hypothetical protein